MRTYEPAEFASRLASNRLDEPVDITIHGLVKPDEHDGSTLLFSTSAPCGRWMPIPVSQIASIRHLGNATCGDHTHPLVRIVLAAPNAEDLAATLFMRLFALEKMAKHKARQQAARRGAKIAQRGGCEVLTFDDVSYECCPPDGGGSWLCHLDIDPNPF
jgi:hypothetical protein